MARPSKPVDPNAPAKAKRPIGPRTVFLVFKEGTDPAVVNAAKDALEEVTLNSRTLLKMLTGGNLKPFLQYKVQVEARDGGDDTAAA